MTAVTQSLARLFGIIFGLVLIVPCKAGSGKDEVALLEECAGRMQLSIPAESEVSAILPTSLSRSYRLMTGEPEAAFPDGQIDGYSHYVSGGRLLITHPVNDAQFRSLSLQFSEMGTKDSDPAPVIVSKLQRPKVLSVQLETSTAGGRARMLANWIAAFEKVGESAVEYNIDASTHDKSLTYFKIFKGATQRRTFEIPSRIGLCFPYIFIPDDGKKWLNVSMSWRPKQHPDVTIWLENRSGGRIPEGLKPEKFTPIGKNLTFWSLRYQNRNAYRYIDKETTTLAGIPAKSSTVELKREDGTIDFGYFAAATGDPDKDPNPTDLEMFVIRDAKNAIAKGVEPMEEKAFIRLAHRISESVKFRPTSAP